MGLVGFAAHASPLPFCTGVWSRILLTDPCRPTPMPEDCVYVAAVKGTPPSPSSGGVDEPSADARQRRRLHLFNDRKRQAPDTTSPREEPAPSRTVEAPGADPKTLERTARFGSGCSRKQGAGQEKEEYVRQQIERVTLSLKGT